MSCPMSDQKLAERFDVVPRTIRRWRKAGAPLGNGKRMRAWLAGRRHVANQRLDRALRELERQWAEVLAMEAK
jgi:hypothetical protein